MAGDDRWGYAQFMGPLDLSHVMANFGQYAHLLPFSPNAGFLLAFGENLDPWGTALGPDAVPHGVGFSPNASRKPVFGEKSSNV